MPPQKQRKNVKSIHTIWCILFAWGAHTKSGTLSLQTIEWAHTACISPLNQPVVYICKGIYDCSLFFYQREFRKSSNTPKLQINSQYFDSRTLNVSTSDGMWCSNNMNKLPRYITAPWVPCLLNAKCHHKLTKITVVLSEFKKVIYHKVLSIHGLFTSYIFNAFTCQMSCVFLLVKVSPQGAQNDSRFEWVLKMAIYTIGF